MCVQMRLLDVSEGLTGEWWGEIVLADEFETDHHITIRLTDDELWDLEYGLPDSSDVREGPHIVREITRGKR